MRIVVTKRDAGFTEAVALLDWQLDTELTAGRRSLDADAAAIADVEVAERSQILQHWRGNETRPKP